MGSPSMEQHVIGVFDVREDGHRCNLTLESSAMPRKARPGVGGEAQNQLGMCMALCGVPCLGPNHLLAVYESTDTCIWDLRNPQLPYSPSKLAGDPASPAICAAMLWRQVWVASADGSIRILKLRKSGELELAPATVQAEAAPYVQKVDSDSNAHETWQSEKGGV